MTWRFDPDEYTERDLRDDDRDLFEDHEDALGDEHADYVLDIDRERVEDFSPLELRLYLSLPNLTASQSSAALGRLSRIP